MALCALLLAICLTVGLLNIAVAEGTTTLTVACKGVTPTNAQTWLSLSLTGRFDVSVDGNVIGRVTANPTAEQQSAGETDTLTIPSDMTGAVTLIPVAEDFSDDYVCQGPIPVTLTQGTANSKTVFAYAKRGLFKLQNLTADGSAAGTAEFMVLDAQGTMLWSFATDASGAYTAERALPDGAYQLVQMRSPEGTLLLDQPLAFTVDTYFGNAESIAQVSVTNPAVPTYNGRTGDLALTAGAFETADGLQYATLNVDGLCAGENDLPLNAYTVTFSPAALLDQEGNPLSADQAVFVDTLTVTRDDGGSCRVQALDASGQPVGDATLCTTGTAVTLTNAAGAAVTYLNDKGEVTLPAGFVAGTVQVRLRYEPVAFLPSERSAAQARVRVNVNYTYQYPGTDGISTVSAASDIQPAEALIDIQDGRLNLDVSAATQTSADGMPELLLTSATQNMPETPLAMVAALPAGARVLESALPEALRLIRTAENDWIVFDTSLLAAGTVIIPLEAGEVQALTLWAYDPCDYMKTADAPEGYALKADTHEGLPLLDTLLSYTDGRYARLEVALPAAVATGKTAVALSALLTGSVAEQADQPTVSVGNLGVLLTGSNARVYYGAVTDASGAFTLSGDGAQTVGTLLVSLPANTMETETQTMGVFSAKDLSLPQDGYAIRFAQRSGLAGTVTTVDGKPLAGIALELSQNGQPMQPIASDVNGEYIFTGLTAGTYDLRVTPPVAGSATFAAQGMEPSTADGITVFAGIPLAYGEQRELDLTATLLGTVRGTVLQDQKPVSGLTVTLTGPAGAMPAQTDENGAYAFAGLAAGDYQIGIALPDNLAIVSRNGQKEQGLGSYTANLTLAAGETHEDQLTMEATASITGKIDALGAGQDIAAASVDAQVTATTAADGSFAFEGLIGGDYTVYAPLPDGKTLTDESQWKVTEKGNMIWITVNAAAGSAYTLPEVEYVAMTSIEGVAYMDANADLQYTEDEQLMTGVTVALQRKDGDAWTDVDSLATDAYGHYAFQNLKAGVYRVVSKAGNGVGVAAVGKQAQTLGEVALGVMSSGEIKLANGDSVSGQSDVALSQPATLNVGVFYDSNEDGARGVYERSVAGVTVEAVPADAPDGAAAASAVTDANGEAVLNSLAAGNYVLRFTLPEGYLFTVNTGKWNVAYSCVGGSDSLSAVSDPIALEAGQTAEAGAGVIPVGSFSGKVWSDLNNNGVLDADEPGVADIKLTLSGTRTGNTYTFTTDDTGLFSFGLLRDDAYDFTAEISDGMLFARYTQTGGDSRSVFTTEGTVATRQFVVSEAENVTSMNVGVVQKSTLAGTAFLDLNYNGVYDEGEPPYKGVTVELVKNSNDRSMGKVVTGDDGQYLFDSLRGGDYRLRAILPADGSIFTVVPAPVEGLYNQFAAREGRRENTLPSVTLTNGNTTETCVGVAVGGTISGTVFLDTKYDGERNGSDKKASGVKVQLVDASGTLAASATTNANGNYTLEGIMPGTYTVRFQRREGYAFTRFRPDAENGNHVKLLAKDGYGETEAIQVTMGQAIEHINAGMLPSSTLTGVFFDDLNDNGLQDEGETGFTDGSVRLLSEDGELDLTETVGEDGVYFFDGVMPGTYTLTYILPDNAAMANVAEGGNTLEAQGKENVVSDFAVESGKAYTAPLVGAVTLGTFEGYAYHDANGNGVRDEGEETLENVKITLKPGKANLETAEASTGADGRFAIKDLRPSAYTLTLALPDGYIFSADLKESNLTLDTAAEDTLACPWAALVNRAQNAVGAVKPATIRASVWLDENRDGQQASEERLLTGLNYELYDETLGKVVKTAVSDDSGYVTFNNVRPASYTVRFTIPDQAQPAGEAESTFASQGAMMSHSGIVVAEGETFDKISGGLVSYTSIGGEVALDEGGTRTVLGDVSVLLYQGDAEEPVKATRTDENGTYRFDGLWPDTYRVAVEEPTGMIFVKPEDPNYEAGVSVITATVEGVGTSDPFTLKMAQHQLSMDAILIKPARVGDQVWLDTNANGLMDTDEPSINGVSIQLLQDGQVVYTTTSNEWGYYELAGVYPGTYTLRAQAYPELTITTPVPALRIISSCLTAGDGNSATSDAFSVESGSRNLNFDLGYVLAEGQTLPAAIVKGSVQSWPATVVK